MIDVIAYLNKLDKHNDIFRHVTIVNNRLPIFERFDNAKLPIGIAEDIRQQGNEIVANIILNRGVDYSDKVFRIMGIVKRSKYNRETKVNEIIDAELISISMIPKIEDVYE